MKSNRLEERNLPRIPLSTGGEECLSPEVMWDAAFGLTFPKVICKKDP